MPISNAEIDVIVRRIAGEQVGVEPRSINAGTAFVEDLNFDSLDSVEFIMGLEEAFEFSVPDDRAGQVRTVGQACDLVAELIGASTASP